MGEENRGSKKKKGPDILRTIVLVIAVCVLCYSAYQLFTIFGGYKKADDEYSDLAETFTHSYDATAESTPDAESTPPSERDETREKEEQEQLLIEDADPPLTVDWEELKAVNPDIVGWLYVDAEDNISYPICLGEDNDYYLHHTFRKESVFAGSIFEDFHNSSDFADPNTIVYGHNMKNGSMFGMLKFIDDQEKYDADPFFWILTPYGNYRYHIFSIFRTDVDSDVYTLFGANGPELLKWEQKLQKASDVTNSVRLSESDKVVVLSTCTSDSSKRCVVIGKCVSSARPVRQAGARHYVEPTPEITPSVPAESEESGAEY